MELLEMKSAKITKKGQIAIPKSVRKLEGFSEGSKVAILAFKDRVELKPMKQISRIALTALASEKTLAKDWDTKEEDDAWKNL
ncbi:AbrB/MazE/SpoVT family DNA-binding domain-containing protein [Candidatus Woesearchaeota archaeon]|nr:AbrB/MazE/SpoVT family DNA-binding domain-containing protein [Candidatus Woesearchaeota archaeon]